MNISQASAVNTANPEAPTPSEPPAKQWVRYFFDQTKEQACPTFKSNEGVCLIEGIKFRLNDDLGERTIKPGSYELRITEVTKGLPSRMKTKNTKILIKFVDLDEEAALLAAAAEKAVQSKGGKKK